MIKMEVLTSSPQLPSDNTTDLISLIALFCAQGNTEVANRLLKTLKKNN